LTTIWRTTVAGGTFTTTVVAAFELLLELLDEEDGELGAAAGAVTV
jgi:hypothetical protein